MKILQIDHDPITVFLTAQFLRNYPSANTFHSFGCPLAALQFIRQQLRIGFPPDVIFLDPNTILLHGKKVQLALQSLEPYLRGQCAVYLLSSSLGAGEVLGLSSALIAGLVPLPLDGPTMQLVERHLMQRRWDLPVPLWPGNRSARPLAESATAGVTGWKVRG